MKRKDYIILSENDFKERVRTCIKILFKEEGLNPINIPIKISKRMSRTRGYFSYNKTYENGNIKYKPNKLQFSNEMINGVYTSEFMDQVILHETIHYLLFAKNHYGEKHGLLFKKYCRKYNCRLDGASSKSEYSSMSKDIKPIRKYSVKCDECSNVTWRDRKSKLTEYPEYYRCKCGGTLTVIKNR